MRIAPIGRAPLAPATPIGGVAAATSAPIAFHDKLFITGVTLPRSCDAVLGDHAGIELETEAWCRGYSHRTIDDGRTIGPHVVPDRVALGIGEAFDAEALRDGGNQVLRNLRFFMMGDCHTRRSAQGGRAPPVCHTAALGGVIVDDVHRSGLDQAPHAVARYLALTRCDGYRGLHPHPGHQARIIVPMAGFLEPADVQRFDQPGERAGLACAPTPVGVDRKHEIGATGLARNLDALRVLLRREATYLELASGHPGAPIDLHLATDIGEGFVLQVVATNADDRHPVTEAAHELAHASPGRLAY